MLVEENEMQICYVSVRIRQLQSVDRELSWLRKVKCKFVTSL